MPFQVGSGRRYRDRKQESEMRWVLLIDCQLGMVQREEIRAQISSKVQRSSVVSYIVSKREESRRTH